MPPPLDRWELNEGWELEKRKSFAALKGDGSVVTWGDRTSGGVSSSVSSSLVNVQSIFGQQNTRSNPCAFDVTNCASYSFVCFNEGPTSSCTRCGSTYLLDAASNTCFVSGSATSDPHLVGPNGETFDFDGEPGSTYSLAPKFQVAMHMAGDGPGTHFMREIGVLFKGEEFLFAEPTMTEAFGADLEERLTRVGDALLDWSSYHAKLALCPGHTVSITQMHTTNPSNMHANGSPYNYYDVATVSRGCHDTYDGALGQTYKCRYAGADAETFAWSHGQEETFRLPTLFTPSGSYSADVASCDAEPAGVALSGTSARHRRRGLMSGAGKPAEANVESTAAAAGENQNALPSHPLG